MLSEAYPCYLNVLFENSKFIFFVFELKKTFGKEIESVRRLSNEELIPPFDWYKCRLIPMKVTRSIARQS
jgi:hypothetical protein